MPAAQRRLLRLKQIIGPEEKRIPISKSSWWQGVRDGRFPQPVRLSPRCTCWYEDEVDALIERLASAPDQAA